MTNTAQSTASTQKFTEILDIVEDIVLLSGGCACLIIEVGATNFALLSKDEQDAKLFAYASLLNSLSFPIQIVVRSKKFDISAYLNLLKKEQTVTKNTYLARQIGLYRDFIEQLIKVNSVLDKKFYISIPYSSLEKGISGARDAINSNSTQNDFFLGAKTSLRSKAEGLHAQLQRIGLKGTTLQKEALIKLLHESFNDISLQAGQKSSDMTRPMVLGKENNSAK